MQFRGRIFAVGVVTIFNILRYFYYHVYLALRFELNFFILTIIFLTVAWWCGKQYDRAKYYSEKDPLTDTYNRRTIEYIYPRLSESCLKNQSKLALLMIDLDNFKAVNDQFGHLAGDLLLKDIAASLQKMVLKDCYVARWGGDEFVVLIPGATSKSLDFYIKKLQIDKSYKNDLDSTLVGMSVGFAVFPDDGVELETLIQKADKAMYKKKRLKVNI